MSRMAGTNFTLLKLSPGPHMPRGNHSQTIGNTVLYYHIKLQQNPLKVPLPITLSTCPVLVNNFLYTLHCLCGPGVLINVLITMARDRVLPPLIVSSSDGSCTYSHITQY